MVDIDACPAASMAMITVALSAAVLSALMVWWLVHRFRRLGIVDQVGERSSHLQATPRGGGVGFVIATTIALLVVSEFRHGVETRLLVGVVCAGLAVAGIGFMDDLRGLRAPVRLAVHLAAAALGVWCAWPLAGVAPLFGTGLIAFLMLVVAVAWFVNAFNFMDGTDAFAASNTLAALGLLAVLLVWSSRGTVSEIAVCGSVAAGLIGFLPFNWPRARIFMGDAGSGWLGLMTALSIMAAWRSSPADAFAALAFLAPFIMDPTVCLVRRACRGERVWQAHRSHGYQNLVRRLGSHARLLGAWWLVGGLVYLPLSLLVHAHGAWPWLPLALMAGATQAVLLRSGVPGVCENGDATAGSRSPRAP